MVKLDKQSIRRKLVKTAVSAPLVMTVPSAMGTSRTTFTACLANAALKPDPSPMLTKILDEVLRVAVDIYECSLVDDKGNLKKLPGQYFVGFDKVSMWRMPDKSSKTGLPTLVTDFNANTLGLRRSRVDRINATAYVSEHGQIVGYGPQKNGGQWTTKSCYTSVIAQPAKRTWL